MKYSFHNNKLKKYRELRGYSQKEAALLIGLKTTNPIADWEEGKSSPGSLHLIRLGVIYQIGPEKFYPDLFKKIGKEIRKRSK